MATARDGNAGTSYEAARTRPARALHASREFAVSASDTGHVSVEVSLGAALTTLSAVRRSTAAGDGAAVASDAGLGTSIGGASAHALLREAVRDVFARAFAEEIGKVVGSYRTMLREGVVRGDDPELRAALNRARLQEKLLAGTAMADQAQACELLGLSGANPSATMRRKEDRREILRFTVDGRAAYPLFQFDVEGRRPFPVVKHLLDAKPGGWSAFRLLHWLTRPHLDFDGTPAGALPTRADEVLAAFRREAEPEVHG